ncbi:MAG TPA: thermonuclease family protein [Candidatus Omnitrophota bacterium]|nr:thermonuclease family protein [Candidatus Omnitrophota bacterium]HPS37620.1 thermonuclease family protein [Candidatus Omnitrophota bacterium]
MARSAVNFLVAVAVFVTVGASAGRAETVEDVTSDGTLVLSGGKKVVLAGIRIDPEGISVLRVLVKKQDLRLDQATVPPPDASQAVYAYLKAKSLTFPAKPQDVSEENEILLNGFLLSLGAARVAEAEQFEKKAEFMELQAEAKKKGEGVWSYVGS